MMPKNAQTHSHYYKSHSQATLLISNQTDSLIRTKTLDHASICQKEVVSRHQQHVLEERHIITMSSGNINAVSPDKHNTTSTENVVATSTKNTNTTSTGKIHTASANEHNIVSSNTIVAASSTTIAALLSDNMIATSPNDIASAHAPTTTTPTKRKRTTSDAQEEMQSGLKKKARTLNAFEYIRDTFGYAFKDPRLLAEALNTTPALRAQSNQSLALIGDSILQLTIYRDWHPSRQPKDT